MGPAGPMGPAGENGLTSEWYNIPIEVSNWQLQGAMNEIGSYYYCLVKNIVELREDIYRDGLILCYYEFIDDAGDHVMAPLPYTVYDINVNNGVETPYEMHFSYDVTPGSILLKLTYSDFMTQWTPPSPCRFKLVLIY
jgi:hypothetical protein